MEVLQLNNEVQLEGKVDSVLTVSHEIYGEVFYKFYLSVPRLSECMDNVLITVSERMLNEMGIKIGDMLQVEGQYRSYNNYTGEGNKLILTVFAKNIYPMTENFVSPNYVYLNGYICKAPTYRTTPFGREIADILLAVNRHYGKSDYIPCIAWGRNAKFCSALEIGTNLKVWGRIQSRQYKKKIDDEIYEERTAYEVSISKMEIVKG
ncbi:MAG: single-stranded DNA-binding protein [Clostridia bacterium]|nr:single-stranded DNA-binding protein [Clostridia bacterium]